MRCEEVGDGLELGKRGRKEGKEGDDGFLWIEEVSE
jgi:hypothetical protein